ncbi:MAG: tRNA pseudouridine(38-40) synthase TruA [Sulfurospirillum sp.]|nr:tRNA pseudouridine(38-40) synthase TruA [Sulfurospirillum sp.]
MHKVKIVFSYDGSKYFGLQIQKQQTKMPTVIGAFAEALKVLNIQMPLVASGRTDRGVHAIRQVAHLEIPDFWSDLNKLQTKLNELLDASIYVQSIINCKQSFHARYHATKRHYRYVLHTGKISPFLAPYALHVEELDVQKLDFALQNFVGIHNFEFFHKKGDIAQNYFRQIYKARAYAYKNYIIISFIGSSFLRSQVRMMSDFAIKIAKGELNQEQLQEQLYCQKKHSYMLTPPNGLYLSRVHY